MIILIYNIESFLFQSKSFLDVFAQIIAYSFEEEISTFESYGIGLIKKLEKNSLNKYLDYVKKVIDILKSHHNWIKNLIEVRDEVVHYSDIEGLSCFIIKMVSENDLNVTVYYPSMPDGKRVSVFMDESWTNLKSLLSEIISILVDKLRKDNIINK